MGDAGRVGQARKNARCSWTRPQKKQATGSRPVACDLSGRRSFGGNLGESTKNSGQTLMEEEEGDQHLDE